MSRRTRISLLFGVVALVTCSALLAAITSVVRRPAPQPPPSLHTPQAPRSTGPNMLFICVDTLRADHVGLYGYRRATTPHIDAFFGRGRVFEFAYTPAPVTTPSVVSMFTGLYPHRHGVRLLMQKLAPEVVTVIDILRAAGYQTAGVVSNALLTDEASGLGGRFDHYDDAVDEREPFRDKMYERKAARTTDAALQWLTHQRLHDRPHFLWVHYIDPHGPYRPPSDKPVDFTHNKPRHIDPARVPKFSREPGLTDGLEYVDRYDEEIAYVDREVGRLLEAYEKMGLADSAVVIFTSDHGESMMDHDHWFRHQVNVYEEMIRVPLAIRCGGLVAELSPACRLGGPARRIDVPVSTVDLAPTILEIASLSVPPGLDGRSLLGKIEPRDLLTEGRSRGGGMWRGLISGKRKTSARHGMLNVIRESRVFDLTSDPAELRPMALAPDDPGLAILTRLIGSDPDPGGIPKRYDAGTLPAPGVAPGPSLDAEMRSQLESLGYVGGG